MIIRRASKRALGINEPLRHESHKRPVTRRDFLAQGFTTGAATIIAPTLLSLLGSRRANALSTDIDALRSTFCNIQQGAGKVPFMAFDLAGGANIAGSNVLVGQQGGQMSFLSTAGYAKQGLPGNMNPTTSVTGSFVDTRLGLAFHSDSAFLRGMMTKISPTTAANINGVVIAARSENDTSNNPHNPMYGLAKTGVRGELLTLIGSQNSISGGNSMSPAMMIDPSIPPTKIDRTSDCTGLVDTGQLGTLLPSQAETVSVMESIERVTAMKLGRVTTNLAGAGDIDAEKLVQCSYVKTAYQAEQYGSPDVVNPRSTTDVLVGAGGVFTEAEVNGDREFEKTASIAKLIVNGYGGAGTVAMGGYDYHTGNRMDGEARDFRAGICMGAALEYAARKGKPLMIYCFSDGSLSSNGTIDNSVGGRGKCNWIGDNQATAASFILVYNPTGRPVMTPTMATARQIGHYSAGGDVVTSSSPAANAVNLLVETVILNYMALHGEEGNFQTLFPNTGLSTAQMNNVLAFGNLASATPTPPPPPPPPVVITSCGSMGASISMNHGHTLNVPAADLNSTVPMTYSIMGTGTHNHMVTLSLANLAALRTGPVTVTSTMDSTPAHDHMVTVTCV